MVLYNTHIYIFASKVDTGVYFVNGFSCSCIFIFGSPITLRSPNERERPTAFNRISNDDDSFNSGQVTCSYTFCLICLLLCAYRYFDVDDEGFFIYDVQSERTVEIIALM